MWDVVWLKWGGRGKVVMSDVDYRAQVVKRTDQVELLTYESTKAPTGCGYRVLYRICLF